MVVGPQWARADNVYDCCILLAAQPERAGATTKRSEQVNFRTVLLYLLPQYGCTARARPFSRTSQILRMVNGSKQAFSNADGRRAVVTGGGFLACCLFSREQANKQLLLVLARSLRTCFLLNLRPRADSTLYTAVLKKTKVSAYCILYTVA